jgi:hypothetical protein
MLVAHLSLTAQHKPTTRTTHVVEGRLMPMPARLRVEQLEGDPGFYLLYCTAEGDELSDTYHETIEAAFGQAEWEFGVRPDEWTRVTVG